MLGPRQVGALSGQMTGGGAAAMRLPTGIRENVSFQGVGLNTQVSFADRPVTQHGISGMKTAGTGRGRQVMDNSYYLSLLHQRINDLQKENAKFKRDISKFHADNTEYSQLERKYEVMIRSVRSLEGQLADYNLAIDKARVGTDPNEISSYQQSLHAKNVEDSRDVDKVFVARSERERMVQEILDKLDAERQESMDSGPKTVSPEQRKLQKRLAHLERKKVGMEKQLEVLRMDPKAARTMLLSQVKADTLDLKQKEAQIAEAEEHTQELKQRLDELKDDLRREQEAASTGQSSASKVDMLREREREIDAYMAEFPQQKEYNISELDKSQRYCVALLESISNVLIEKPGWERYKELKDKLDFKKRYKETAETTHTRLQSELKKREEELNKIKKLDVKISGEVTQLEEATATMKKEMLIFGQIPKLKEAGERTKQQLMKLKHGYVRRRDGLRPQVQQVAAKYEELKGLLVSNDTASMLESLEQRLRHGEQNNFALSEYLEEKRSECDFETIRDDCVRLTDALNAHHATKPGDVITSKW